MREGLGYPRYRVQGGDWGAVSRPGSASTTPRRWRRSISTTCWCSPMPSPRARRSGPGRRRPRPASRRSEPTRSSRAPSRSPWATPWRTSRWRSWPGWSALPRLGRPAGAALRAGLLERSAPDQRPALHPDRCLRDGDVVLCRAQQESVRRMPPGRRVTVPTAFAAYPGSAHARAAAGVVGARLRGLALADDAARRALRRPGGPGPVRPGPPGVGSRLRESSRRIPDPPRPDALAQYPPSSDWSARYEAGCWRSHRAGRVR